MKIKLLLFTFVGLTIPLMVCAVIPRFFIKNITNYTDKEWLVAGFIKDKAVTIAQHQELHLKTPLEIDIFQIFGNVLGQLKINDPVTYEKKAAVDFQISRSDVPIYNVQKALLQVHIRFVLPNNLVFKTPLQKLYFHSSGDEKFYFDLILKGVALEHSELVESQNQIPGS